MKSMPGIMLYFDTRSCLDLLTREEAGELFTAMLDYGQFGIVPQLKGGAAVAWAFLAPYIDRDRARYEEKSRRNTEAANRRWGTDPALLECERMPKTKTKTKTTSSPKTKTETKTPTASEERRRQWAHMLSIEEEIAEKNRQARAYSQALFGTPLPITDGGHAPEEDPSTSSMNSAMAGL